MHCAHFYNQIRCVLYSEHPHVVRHRTFKQDKELLEHGLFVLWEILPHLDGRDTDVFALLLRLRYAQDFNVSSVLLVIDEVDLTLRP